MFHFTGYYLANPFKNCNETCSDMPKVDLFCSPVITPYDRPLIDLWNPNNYTKTIDFECPSHASNNYSKSIDPMIDVTDNSCHGFDHPPARTDCAAVPDVATDRRLCYCEDKCKCKTFPEKNCFSASCYTSYFIVCRFLKKY